MSDNEFGTRRPQKRAVDDSMDDAHIDFVVPKVAPKSGSMELVNAGFDPKDDFGLEGVGAGSRDEGSEPLEDLGFEAEVRVDSEEPSTGAPAVEAALPVQPGRVQTAESGGLADSKSRKLPKVVPHLTRTQLVSAACVAVIAVILLVGGFAFMRTRSNASKPDGGQSAAAVQNSKDTESSPAKKSKTSKSEEALSDTDISEKLSSLRYNGEAVGVDASSVAVTVRYGHVMVVETTSDGGETLLRNMAYRASALASELNGAKVKGSDEADPSTFSEVTWVMCDSESKVQAAVRMGSSSEVTVGSLSDVLQATDGYVMTYDLFNAIGGEDSGVAKSHGMAPSTPDGKSIVAGATMADIEAGTAQEEAAPKSDEETATEETATEETTTQESQSDSEDTSSNGTSTDDSDSESTETGGDETYTDSYDESYDTGSDDAGSTTDDAGGTEDSGSTTDDAGGTGSGSDSSGGEAVETDTSGSALEGA